MPPRRKLAAFRATTEHFTRITWHEPNRVAHEAKRGFPPWRLLPFADWTRVCKRKDVEHPGPPDRFQALVRLDLQGRAFILFVAYFKDHQALHVITTRVATDRESQAFHQHHP